MTDRGPEGRDTAMQLRGDIQSGRTGEKVDVHDPAASPLGTDDEAAGVPRERTEAAATLARAQENRPPSAERTDPSRTQSATANPKGLPIILALVAVVVLAVVLWMAVT